MWLPIKPAPPVTNARCMPAEFIISPKPIESAPTAVIQMLFLRKMNNPRAIKLEMEWNPSESAHCCEKPALSRWWAVEQQKSAAAGADQLSTQRAGFEPFLVVSIDGPVG